MNESGLDAIRAEPVDGSVVIGRTESLERGANFSSRGSSECMSVSKRHRPGRETTRAHLETIAGGDGAVRIRRQVQRWNTGATADQVEDAFQEACARAHCGCHGQVEAEVYNWLRTATHRCLVRMRERRAREPIAAEPFDDLVPNELCAPGTDVVVLAREKHTEVTAVAKVVLGQLSARQLDIAALHAHGFRRREIAERTQLSPRVVKRLMEQVLAIGRAELAEKAGHGCEEGHDQVARYAFGLAGAREAHRAQAHLTTCERCGAMYERLDLWREKVAALLPVPPVIESQTDVLERVVHAGTELVAGTPSPAEGTGALPRRISEIVGHAREHAVAAYYRTIDPTPLAGARPGAVAAAVASCLALGGGATYCVKENASPITALGFGAPAAQQKDKPKHKRARAAQAPAPAPTTTPTATPPPAVPQTIQQAPPPTTTQPAALPPAPEDEYEPTSPGASAQTTSTKPRREPQPAPAEGPIGEFDGP